MPLYENLIIFAYKDTINMAKKLKPLNNNILIELMLKKGEVTAGGFHTADEDEEKDNFGTHVAKVIDVYAGCTTMKAGDIVMVGRAQLINVNHESGDYKIVRDVDALVVEE